MVLLYRNKKVIVEQNMLLFEMSLLIQSTTLNTLHFRFSDFNYTCIKFGNDLMNNSLGIHLTVDLKQKTFSSSCLHSKTKYRIASMLAIITLIIIFA